MQKKPRVSTLRLRILCPSSLIFTSLSILSSLLLFSLPKPHQRQILTLPGGELSLLHCLLIPLGKRQLQGKSKSRHSSLDPTSTIWVSPPTSSAYFFLLLTADKWFLCLPRVSEHQLLVPDPKKTCRETLRLCTDLSDNMHAGKYQAASRILNKPQPALHFLLPQSPSNCIFGSAQHVQ